MPLNEGKEALLIGFNRCGRRLLPDAPGHWRALWRFVPI